MSVSVTGMGVFCAIGSNVNEMWEAIEKGVCGIRAIEERFDVSQFDTKLGAMPPSWKNFTNDEDRILSYGMQAAEEAIRMAGVNDRSRIALISGTSNGLLEQDITVVGTKLAHKLNIGGPVLNISTACTSSTQAIGLAADMIINGEQDLVLAGGLDVLTSEVYSGFHRLGLLSKNPCTPFSLSIGTTLGEGAAFILLESNESAQKREATSFATVLGSCTSADAFHATKPDPKGSGMARAIKTAISRAGIKTTDIQYINVHGTATAANDSSEWNGIKQVFGEQVAKLPISSSKGHYGHVQGGAGAIEAITTIQAMAKGVVPPTLNLVETRPNVPEDLVMGNTPRPHKVDYAVSTNAAFGGVNSALVLSKSHNGSTETLPRPEKIAICSTGQAFSTSQLGDYVPSRELRSLDITAKYLAGAVAKSLDLENIKLRSPQCMNIDLIVGQDRISYNTYCEFRDSIRDRGVRNLSADAFARMVVNHATGVCSQLFELKGFTTTLSTDNDSGLAALVLGADQFKWKTENSYVIAAAVDEPKDEDSFNPQAASVLLKTDISYDGFYLTGWSLAADNKTAIANAIAMSGISPDGVKSVLVDGSLACSGLNTIISTINNYKSDEPGAFLFSNQRKGSAGAAVIIEKY